MRKLIIIIVLFNITNLFAGSLYKRIKKYSGKNASELINLIKTSKGDTLKYSKFLLENASANDLAVLKANYLKNNIKFAIKSRDLPYTKGYSENIFMHFVLPPRISQEPFEDWREKFYNELYPKVKDVKDIEEVAIILNLWANEQLYYKSTHGRDQAPLTSIKRGIGRCEEMMILYIAAARSIGIPARPTSAPYWNFTNNNHAWVEVWTPDGWKYLGDNNALNDAWFSNTSKRATLIVSEVFGNYKSKDVIKNEDNVTYLSSIKNYTDPVYCKILVKDKKNKSVKNAKISLYATSWGGLFSMFSSKTDKNGLYSIPIGKGTVFLSAFKDGKFGYTHLNTMKDSIATIILSDNKEIDTTFDFIFPLQGEGGVNLEKKYFFKDTFKTLKENSSLRREKLLYKQEHTTEFTNWYDKTEKPAICDSAYIQKRDDFLKTAIQTAGNAENYLKIFKTVSDEKRKYLVDMINEWDIKELVEIPDSTAIAEMLQIYADARKRFGKFVPDSIFVKNTIHRTWRSAIPPENGWHKEFYDMILSLVADTPEKTVKNVIKWVNKQVKIEKDFVWTYFSGSLNPLDILNMRFVPDWYRTKLINSALKDLGVPVQWDARLEYWNGDKFVVVEENKDKKEKTEDKKKELKISIFVDGKQQKAEPWENFFISTMDDDGRIGYIDFDDEKDSLSVNVKYRPKKDKIYYAEAFVRNSNGDANIVIKTIKNQDSIRIDLKMPKEYVDSSNLISKKELMRIDGEILSKTKNDTIKVIVIRANQSAEPETRMLNQIYEKKDNFQKKKVTVIVYSQDRDNADIKNKYESFKFMYGEKILSDKIADNDYPIILLFKNNELKFAVVGYKMGIATLLLKKVK